MYVPLDSALYRMLLNDYLCFVQELSLLVEEQERDGEGAAAARPLAQSSPVPVRIVLETGMSF